MRSGVLLFLLLVLHVPVKALTLSEYLKTVESQHKSVKALNIAEEVADLVRESGDISLVPYLSAEVAYSLDKSPLSQFALIGATESRLLSYNLALGKRFASGTDLQIYAKASEIRNEGNLMAPLYERFGSGALGVGFSQSLWKDSFGHGVGLRQEREGLENTARKREVDLQKSALLVQAEAAFWNYLAAAESLRIGTASLDRAKKIETWTRRRVSDGISDRADLLETQGLVTARQFQLITLQDEMEIARRQIRDFLELPASEPLPEITGDISAARPLSQFIDGKKGRVVALEAYIAAQNAKTQELRAQETDDQLRPDLVLKGSYNTNTLEEDMGGATANMFESDRPTAQIALTLLYQFDTSVKQAAKNASRKNALSAQLQAERKMLDSDSQWIELNRRYVEMSKRIEVASEGARIQTARAQAQTSLFNKGRSITYNVVNSEEDAANAELNLYRLRAEQRKMEAQGRMFITLEN